MSEKEFNELVKSLLESVEVISSGANEMKKLLAAVNNSKPTAEIKDETKTEEKTEEISHDMVRQVLSALSGNGKAFISRDILAKFNAKRLTDLKPENYAEAYSLAKEALNG